MIGYFDWHCVVQPRKYSEMKNHDIPLSSRVLLELAVPWLVFSKLITNSAKPYYHYIPRHSSINAGIIDFQDKYSIPVEELEQKINTKAADNFATISMPFLKDLIERYSSYYARQGSPDFDSDEIIESLIR